MNNINIFYTMFHHPIVIVAVILLVGLIIIGFVLEDDITGNSEMK